MPTPSTDVEGKLDVSLLRAYKQFDTLLADYKNSRQVWHQEAVENVLVDVQSTEATEREVSTKLKRIEQLLVDFTTSLGKDYEEHIRSRRTQAAMVSIRAGIQMEVLRLMEMRALLPVCLWDAESHRSTFCFLQYGCAIRLGHDEAPLPNFKASFRHLLGPAHRSYHAKTTYHCSTLQPLDVSGMRFNEAPASDTATAELLASDVFFTHAQWEGDCELQEFLAIHGEKETKIYAEFNCQSHDITDEFLSNTLVSDTRDAWENVLEINGHQVKDLSNRTDIVAACMTSTINDDDDEDDGKNQNLNKDALATMLPELCKTARCQ
ncbi:hypothetical protein F5880DRAFT_1613561 [Lentinula raphanica]|nr:hypothetical protein F5880DRAFT_1613561 [Lentinula raphanica]